MGIFDFLGGSKKTKTTSESLEKIDLTKILQESQVQTQTKEQIQTQKQLQTQKRTEDITGITTGEKTTGEKTTGVTSALDPETLSILQNLIAQIGGEGARTNLPGSLQAVAEPLEFARLLATRALGTSESISKETTAIIDEARRLGEIGIAKSGTALAEVGGSALNSVAAALQGRGQADLESQLASIAAELNIRGAELESTDLATAFASLVEGLQTGANVSLAGDAAQTQQLVALVQALKGGVTETVGEKIGTEEFAEASKKSLTGVDISETTSVATTQATAIAELIRDLIETQEGTVRKTGSGTTTEKSSPGIIDIIGAIGGLSGFLPK
ncbi:MAG: hypothetical protein IIC67_05605 [Thaumarchaeota archaeon]|nr:hypothetical protein [Nitrososphaerota archaeon]